MSTGRDRHRAAKSLRFGGVSYWRNQFWLSLVMMAFWWIIAGLSFRAGIPWLKVGPAAIFTIMVIVSGSRLWRLSGTDDATQPVVHRLQLWTR